MQVTGWADLVCCIMSPKTSQEVMYARMFTPLLKVLSHLRIPVIVDEPWAFEKLTAHACAVTVRACISRPRKPALADRPVCKCMQMSCRTGPCCPPAPLRVHSCAVALTLRGCGCSVNPCCFCTPDGAAQPEPSEL